MQQETPILLHFFYQRGAGRIASAVSPEGSVCCGGLTADILPFTLRVTVVGQTPSRYASSTRFAGNLRLKCSRAPACTSLAW